MSNSHDRQVPDPHGPRFIAGVDLLTGCSLPGTGCLLTYPGSALIADTGFDLPAIGATPALRGHWMSRHGIAAELHGAVVHTHGERGDS